MKNSNTTSQLIAHGILQIGCVTALAIAFAVALPQAAHADRVTPPLVPDRLQVLAPNRAFLVGHAVGTQNYVCVPSGATFAWTLFTPQATLFDDNGKQIITHFFSPNPFENNTVRATWQFRDTSTFWGVVTDTADSISDPKFVKPGAVAWLKLALGGSQDGPTGGDRLTGTTFVQRVNTVGGVAPSTGCAAAADIGKKAFVPYRADYFFYHDASRDQHDE
jgi:hypothetical protein